MGLPAVVDRSSIVPPDGVLALIQGALDALQTVEDPREAASIVAKADAIRYLAEKADMSFEVQNQAAEVALRAKRRAGELLRDVITHGGAPESHAVTLGDLGIQKQTASRWYSIADIPEERFETYLADEQAQHRELTTAGAVRLARNIEARDGGRQIERWIITLHDDASIGTFGSSEAGLAWADEHIPNGTLAIRRLFTPAEWLESTIEGHQ